MDEIARFGDSHMLAARAPANFAGAREHVGDRFLLAMMVNSGAGAWRNVEQAAPHGRLNPELRRDCRASLGSRRLRRSGVEFIGTDYADRWADLSGHRSLLIHERS